MFRSSLTGDIMKQILAIFLLLGLTSAHAKVTCSDFYLTQQYNSSEIVKVLETPSIITEQNWHTYDVILGLDYNNCKNAIAQELIKFKGEFFWMFRSFEDNCDGGNTAGVIYSLDLKTPLAHIYDSSFECEEDWALEDRYNK
jgi:hypothetical protein